MSVRPWWPSTNVGQSAAKTAYTLLSQLDETATTAAAAEAEEADEDEADSRSQLFVGDEVDFGGRSKMKPSRRPSEVATFSGDNDDGEQQVNASELVSTKRRTGLERFLLLLGGCVVGTVVTVLCFLAVNHARSKIPPPTPQFYNGSSTSGPAGHQSISSPANHPHSDAPSLNTHDYLSGLYYPSRNNGTWISATEMLYRDETGNVLIFDATTQKSKELLNASTGDLLGAAEYHVSADRRYVLISKNVQRIFRHSSFAHYDAIDVRTGEVHPVAMNASAVDFLQLVQWAPHGNALVFVQGNNIYYQPSVLAPAIAVTTDGSRSIGYGTCDWVYEEEIFASKQALWFSPDGRRLAFVLFDDTRVPVISIPVYGEPGRPESQYPHSLGLHYPKVGAPNPLVRLFAVDLSALQAGKPVERHEQLAPEELRSAEHVIAAVGWQSNDTFASAWMNRVQNHAVIQSCRDTDCRIFKRMQSATGWVDLFKPLQFSADGSQMLVILAQPQAPAGAGAWRHLTLVSTRDGSETAITEGLFEVTGVEHWDEAKQRIFFTANMPDRSEVQHVYAVEPRKGGLVTCLSCELMVNGARQTFFSAEFSLAAGGGRHLVVTNDGPDVPEVALYKWSVDGPGKAVELESVAVLERNDDLRAILNGVALPLVSYMDVPLDHGNFTARVRVMVPADVDRTGKTKYPMLVNVYGGPDSYNGNDRFDLGWGNVLVSNRSIVHVQINGRGSGLRGDRLRHAIYRKFGQVEVDDQIEVAGKLSKLLPFIDAQRVAIWGWSYGGFAAALALAKDRQHVFRCAASVAPVTDFQLYDSIYTERFMGLPDADDNALGYAAQRIPQLAEQFRNRTFFLVHGTFDDNVHYQQSMLLSRSLELHDVLFRQMSYPDEGHSLSSVQRHLYHTLGEYFDECFRA